MKLKYIISICLDQMLNYIFFDQPNHKLKIAGLKIVSIGIIIVNEFICKNK